MNDRIDDEDLPPTEHGLWLLWVAAVLALGALVGYVLLAAPFGGR